MVRITLRFRLQILRVKGYKQFSNAISCRFHHTDEALDDFSLAPPIVVSTSIRARLDVKFLCLRHFKDHRESVLTD